MRDHARLISRIFRKRGPEQIIFFVTAGCNLDCAMCFYKSRRRSPAEELTLDEIRRISSGMPPFHWLQISGGEPFLRDDLAEICGIFARNNRVRLINIPTNGSLPGRVAETAGKMLRENPGVFFNIGVSLLGPREVHDRITGTAGSFDRAVSCYQGLRELKGRYTNLGINFTITQSRDNETRLKELFDLVMTEYSPDHIAFNFARGPDLEHRYTGSSPELYRKNWDHLRRLSLRRGDYYFRVPMKSLLYSVNMLQKEITHAVAARDRYALRCYAGRISAVIDETGNLYPCEMRKRPLGNFRESGYSFRSIWDGPVARAERRTIRRSRCYCTHECFITTNIVFNPRLYPALLLKWLGYVTGRGRRDSRPSRPPRGITL